MVIHKCSQLIVLLFLAKQFAIVVSSPQDVHVNCSSSQTCWKGKEIINRIQDTTTSTIRPHISDDSQITQGLKDKSSCPAWFLPDNDSNGCSCGSSLGGLVDCHDESLEVLLLACYCMTCDEELGLVVGACSYNCFYETSTYSPYRRLYNVSEYSLNDEICGRLNRKGRLCGQCEEGYAPPVYSYNLLCVKCNSTDWGKYVAVAYIPLTVFFIVVVVCRISATSPSLNGFVQLSQIISIPAFVRIFIFAVELQPKYSKYSVQLRLLFALYGIWNLDFFRTLIPPICLPVDTLTTIAMDYAVALYPLVLIVITYIFIELHAHNCRLIVLVWKPFHWCLARFRRQWNMRRSIVDAFATFLLLSYVKLLSISFDLLVPTRLYNIHGTQLSTWYLFYDATVKVFGKAHFPYAILAIGVLLVFIISPLLLLLLYPMKCFQRCLNRCGLNFIFLRTFTDSFQGCYKDGTNGTRDCRYFAVVYLIGRIVGLTAYALTLFKYFYLIGALICTSAAILLVVIQPYKKDIHNKIDTIFAMIMALFYTTVYVAALSSSLPTAFEKLTFVIMLVLMLLPLVYVTGLVLHWLYLQSPWLQRKVQWIRRRDQWRAELEELRFPDRLINPDDYSDD